MKQTMKELKEYKDALRASHVNSAPYRDSSEVAIINIIELLEDIDRSLNILMKDRI